MWPKGKVLSPGEVLVEGERIVEAGTHVTHPDGAVVIDLGDTTLMPGLIDAHTHLFLHPGNEGMQTVDESVPQRTLQAAAAAKADVMAGFTAERDMGTEGAECADVAVRNAINSGLIPGPAHACVLQRDRHSWAAMRMRSGSILRSMCSRTPTTPTLRTRLSR